MLGYGAQLEVAPNQRIQRHGQLETNNAAALFLQRARQVNVNLTTNSADLSAITRICQLVEGLPLGLELAATWIRAASLPEIAQEIERSIDFLTTNARDVPARHRSMRAVFDHSWNLLAEEERQVLMRLSVFQGGFTRKAAEQVAGASLPLLSALINKSLVRRGQDRRYDLHELTRQYAAARLEAEKAEAMQTRASHAEFYLTMLANDYDLRSDRQPEAFSSLKLDIDNIRAAWDSAIANGAVDLLRQASGGLYYFYDLQQFFQEAALLYQRAAEMIHQRLESGKDSHASAEKDRLLGALVEVQGRQAFFMMRSGHNTEAKALYLENLERLDSLDEPFLRAYNYTFLGLVTWAMGEYEQSEINFLRGIPICLEVGVPWLIAVGLCFQGALEHDLGRLDAAYEHLREAMAVCRKMSDPYLTLLVGTMFSRTAQQRGQLDQAQELLLESLQIARESGNRWAIGLGLEQLAMIALETGETAQAYQMLEESVALHRDVGDAWSLSRSLHALSRVALKQDNLAAAEQYAVECARMAAGEEFFPNALDGLATLAEVRARQEKVTPALEIILYVIHNPASPPEARTRAEALRAELSAQVSDQQINDLQDRIQSCTIKRFLSETLPP